MTLKRLLSRTVKFAVTSLCCLSLAVFSSQSHATDTFLDGLAADGTTAAPTVFNADVVSDFEGSGNQGWSGVRMPGIQVAGGALQNTAALGSNGETDSYVFINTANSLLPGQPQNFTVGQLPGQYDILQFDLRFDTLPPQPFAAGLRGRQFLQVGGTHGANFFDVTAANGTPDLPVDNDFHTYIIKRDSTDPAWLTSYGRIRIDPIDGINVLSDLSGTFFSLDNVILGRSNVTEPFPLVLETTGANLVSNGDLSATSNVVLGGSNPGAINLNGGNGNFGPFRGSTGDVDDWTPYNNDPNSIVAAVANGGALDLLNASSGNQGSYYLDTHWSTTVERFSLNTAAGYLNGLIQTDILNGVTIDESATYELAFDLEYAFNTADTTLTVALTTGTSATDPGAVTGSLIAEPLGNLTSGAQQTFTISGADLKAAQDSGAVNLIVEAINTTTIPGFPGGTVVPNDHATTAIVSQTRLDNFSLSLAFSSPVGDVNKDGAVTQADATLAQLYLDGNGGETAAVRQTDLLALVQAPTAAEVLASLNLNDFDLTGDDTFDAADVAAIQALVPTVLLGDVNLDGDVDFLDISPFISVLSGGGFQAEADCDQSGEVDFLDISPFIAILSGS